MSIGLETGYEERMEKWKRIYIIFIVLMILIFFALLSDVFKIIKESTPFVLENCEWHEEKTISSAIVFSSQKSALEEAKKYVKGNYSEIFVSEEFEKCVGWLVEFKNNSTATKKILVCRNGWIYIYEKKCKRNDFIGSVIEFLKTLLGE